MIIPVRCFTCNQVIAHLWDEYSKKIQEEYIKDEVHQKQKSRFIDITTVKEKTIEGKTLDKLNIKRYCCRRMFLSHVDLCEII
tara:strand:- start:956 stop:1204 length:249 start_codon:yes stop_codon:yes gene_type:complete